MRRSRHCSLGFPVPPGTGVFPSLVTLISRANVQQRMGIPLSPLHWTPLNSSPETWQPMRFRVSARVPPMPTRSRTSEGGDSLRKPFLYTWRKSRLNWSGPLYVMKKGFLLYTSRRRRGRAMSYVDPLLRQRGGGRGARAAGWEVSGVRVVTTQARKRRTGPRIGGDGHTGRRGRGALWERGRIVLETAGHGERGGGQ